MLPNVKLQLFTNGSFLSLDKYLACKGFIDRLVINSYGDGATLSANARKIKDYLEAHAEEDNNIEFEYRVKNETLTSRGGRSPNRREYAAPKVGCIHPFFQMSVRADGKAYMCCNDALQDRCLGDVGKSSVMEVWQGQAYREFRKKMVAYGRPGLPFCADCDYYPSPYLYDL